MGQYLNPGNELFRTIRNGDYVDKSGMISIINQSIDSPRRMICISRPRRFGKSFAAQMLSAYYDKTCDSTKLFEDLAISKDASFREHMNKYDIIYFDMASVMWDAGEPGKISEYIERQVTKELIEAYPQIEKNESFSGTLLSAVQVTGNKIIMIVDEWDVIFRETKGNADAQNDYVKFLRGLFKNSGTSGKIFAAVYLTGILPIKKYGTQSAMSDFTEYSMLMPWKFAEYIGFTEEEVKDLCSRNGLSFEEMREWYDGYSFREIKSIYNPSSVMMAVQMGTLSSYWSRTESFESLKDYLDMDFDGLQQSIIKMIAGESCSVDTGSFGNDMSIINNRDDVLTLLIHLGYLVYDDEHQTVRIPNKEVLQEFERSVRNGKHTETMKLVMGAEQLLQDTINMDGEAVAEYLERMHNLETNPLYYNNEEALRSTIRSAYRTWVDHYIKIEELPSGKGFADIVFIPKKAESIPMLVIELKWNKLADTAIKQIKDKKYPEALINFGGDILLVGISYDSETKKHTCRIERLAK
ncbi:MAG: AAA family ATPase [Lachnospiraceae bacterium]|nr:AAA family ATPase [Lachnospiraceae bacterium]